MNSSKYISIGMLAHVDAGKTTLSEAMLYRSGAIRKLGRMELDKDLSIQKYVGRKDEVGVICTTLDTTADNLRSYITEMDTQLAAMSEGDFARES